MPDVLPTPFELRCEAVPSGRTLIREQPSVNRDRGTILSAFHAFFHPREAIERRRSQSVLIPFLLAAVLRITTAWLDARRLGEAELWLDLVLAALTPMLLAFVYHAIVRLLLRAHGEVRDLALLFCYASIVIDLLLLPSILATVVFPTLWWARELLGGMMFLYWLYVTGTFSKAVYALTDRQVLILTSAFVLIVIGAAFAAGYSGYRLSLLRHRRLLMQVGS